MSMLMRFLDTAKLCDASLSKGATRVPLREGTCSGLGRLTAVQAERLLAKPSVAIFDLRRLVTEMSL